MNKLEEIKEILEEVDDEELSIVEEKLKYFLNNKEKLVEYLRILNELNELQKRFKKIKNDFKLGAKFFEYVNDFLTSENYENGLYVLTRTKNLSMYFDEEGNVYIQHKNTLKLTIDSKGNIIIM